MSENKEETNVFISEDECIPPILLTEDWLIKFGFPIMARHEDYQGFVTRYKMYFNLKDGFLYDDVTLSWCNHINWRPIKYIHELQKFYSVLTGEELTIKE